MVLTKRHVGSGNEIVALRPTTGKCLVSRTLHYASISLLFTSRFNVFFSLFEQPSSKIKYSIIKIRWKIIVSLSFVQIENFIHVQYTQTESIRLRHFTIRLDSHVTSKLDSHGVASRKSTSGMTNRQQGKRFVSISPLWKRVIAWERSRAPSGYGIIWGDADRNEQEEFSAECHSVDWF